jgi:hypothetical protein
MVRIKLYIPSGSDRSQTLPHFALTLLTHGRKLMDRSKFVAIFTGAIAIGLSLAYLILVQLLDLRGEMIPAPTGWINWIG